MLGGGGGGRGPVNPGQSPPPAVLRLHPQSVVSLRYVFFPIPIFAAVARSSRTGKRNLISNRRFFVVQYRSPASVTVQLGNELCLAAMKLCTTQSPEVAQD
jgi:hypothetical protein